jgi:hypothetical protein
MKTHDLVEDIEACPEIMVKLQAEDRRYAQNLYAAWCNMQWCKRDTWPILTEQYWSASWRSAGGIVADLRGQGEDYMDYYCSGMRGGLSYDGKDDDDYFEKTGYQSEGVVSEEVLNDLDNLGWFPVPYDDDFV